MKKIFLLSLICWIGLFSYAQSEQWSAKRIGIHASQNATNTWIDFRKDFEIISLPGKAMAKIACDSKYWLWVNGEMAIFEGQLKRGPSPKDTYYDEVDLAPFLKRGKNTIAILLWHFGKDGFSHNNSGEAGLVFQCDTINLISDAGWVARMDVAFDDAGKPRPNFRLPESNIQYDARVGNFDWTQPHGKLSGFRNAKVLGEADSAPWNRLVLRPIPQWKNFGVRDYENKTDIPSEGTGNWIICKLPYNCQVTPILEIEGLSGQTIKMQTDNFDYLGLNVASVRAEYITKEGRQRYESLGWMNGHVVKYFIPNGIKIHSLKYRESGFDCEFSGHFSCSDPFYERLWKKAVRTLYVTMRDTYMDCPDRERAQWWGDMVNESGEAFYALSPSASTITKKGMLELINWQREDGTIYSPVPEGNWNKELPGQMLASIGFYGFWNYYVNTGDKETIARIYGGVKRYLDVWQLKPNGTLVEREGDWYWGDWGKEVDKQLLFNAWYYLALKGYLNMSDLLGKKQESQRTRKEMEAFKKAFIKVFWDGSGFRTKAYQGTYDDRGQALAVVSGLAGKRTYNALLKIFKTSFLASPYMEKYVLEALFIMEEAVVGLERMKSRYHNMIDVSPFTTLYENFGDGADRTGYGTNNHAWSGGGLTILAQYVCGLEPIEAAWKSFQVKPQLGTFSFAETGNETVAGIVRVRIEKKKVGMDISLTVPDESNAIVYLPVTNKKIKINGITVFNKNYKINDLADFEGEVDGHLCFKVIGGKYQIIAK